MNFPFGQPEKTRDCGYRCLYYALRLRESYENWLNNFRFFSPTKHGILFQDICEVLKYYGKSYKFTHLDDTGLFIVYSGIWLHSEGKKHGHYFIYEGGTVLCSTHRQPQRIPLRDVLNRLEATTVDLAYRCLKVN